MMIGPAPMIRIVEMSVRLGMMSRALRGRHPGTRRRPAVRLADDRLGGRYSRGFTEGEVKKRRFPAPCRPAFPRSGKGGMTTRRISRHCDRNRHHGRGAPVPRCSGSRATRNEARAGRRHRPLRPAAKPGMGWSMILAPHHRPPRPARMHGRRPPTARTGG